VVIPASRRLYYALFALSGFSGLIYESIWSHYLKLFLGHAAYAQTLVLAIFMGGMALGSWLCSRFSLRWPNLLLLYALVEGIIGILALLFHPLFDTLLQASYRDIIPTIGSPAAAMAYKWGSATLMILPQSILLGMTFPLMSAGVIRRYPYQPGASIAMLYFSNSIGAVVGVLVSGFVLIELVGLPGTIRCAGLINLVLALLVWHLARGRQTEPAFSVSSSPQSTSKSIRSDYWFILVALLTGLASFIYEIAWIRMLSLVLGSSTHAFELMLSAFILGLALGGLWIRGRIGRISHPVRFLGGVQLVMGLLALATLALYANSFEVMAWFQQTVPKTDAGYIGFNLLSHGIAIAIMLPTTFCAGMTLPLITVILINRRQGEKAIGRVYAANTLGAIIGVFFAIHVGMPLLGLKYLVSVGAATDMTLGLVLLWLMLKTQPRWQPVTATAIAAIAIVLTLLAVQLDPYKMASGVYRLGRLYSPDFATILYHRDGKTASIDLTRFDQTNDVQVSTNGKPDAVINMSDNHPASPDEATMILLAAIPLSLSSKGGTAASIGMGSGLTTHTLLNSDSISTVDTIEIEPAMVEAAKGFRPRVERAFSDPRSRIYIEDAKTFFSTHNKRYDFIISEPSNPWVSGTASLFTKEFYHLIKQYLTGDGMLVQWLQLYEIDIPLVASVIKALSSEFAHYEIYATDDEDIVIIAHDRTDATELNPRLFASPRLATELYRVGVRRLQDLYVHNIGNKQALDPLFQSYPVAPNSDYYPVLDLNAVKTRFLRRTARELVQLANAPLPVAQLLGQPVTQPLQTSATPNPYIKRSDHVFAATLLRDYLVFNRLGRQYPRINDTTRHFTGIVKTSLIDCQQSAPDSVLLQGILGLAMKINQYLTPRELVAIWQQLQRSTCMMAQSPLVQTAVKLQLAIAVHDAPAMSTNATELLKAKPDVTPEQHEYLLMADMLANITQGKPAAAYALWRKYQSSVYKDYRPALYARLILAHSLLQNNNNSAPMDPSMFAQFDNNGVTQSRQE
jgi:spermidine synthase